MKTNIIAGKIVQIVSKVRPSKRYRLVNLLNIIEINKYPTRTVIIIKNKYCMNVKESYLLYDWWSSIL